MARVFETPTYTLQTAHAVLNMMSVANEILRENIPDYSKRIFACENIGSESNAFLYGYSNIHLPEFDDQLAGIDYEDIDAHMRYCYAEGLKVKNTDKLIRIASYGVLFDSLFKQYPKHKIMTDFYATFELVSRHYNGIIICNASEKAMSRWNHSHSMAINIAASGIISCNLGKEVIDNMSTRIPSYSGYTKDLIRALHACEVWEKMRLSGSTREVAQAHIDIMSTRTYLECFKIKGNYPERNLGVRAIYRISAMTVLITNDVIFILDHAHLDQIRALMKTWYGMEFYAHFYRIGQAKRVTSFLQSYRYLFKWLCQTMIQFKNPEALGKWMKQCMSVLQNNLHNHAEKLDLGASKRLQTLMKDLKDIAIYSPTWFDALIDSGANCREALNLAYMYHLLPCPDAPPLSAYRRFEKQLRETNKGNPKEFETFLNYVKASDLAKLLAKSKGDLKLETEGDYSIEGKKWADRCKRGDFCLPPKSEWGKAYVVNYFKVPIRLYTWYLTVGDVTRIPPLLSNYKTVTARLKVKPFEGNELLYMLNNAPEIEPGYHPKKIYNMCQSGIMPWDKLADVAFKAENTKSGDKMRETLSADAITRELMSEYDQSLIQLAYLYSGVTSRKDDCAVENIFDRINSYTIDRRMGVIISNDASGWSPSAPRHLWSKHHDYCVGLTSNGSWLKLEKILRGIQIAISKRGILQHNPADGGLFQGWTGTADSIFNVHISTYCVRKGKEAGYLPDETRADTAGLIDDAVQGVQFPSSMTKEDCQKAASMHFDTTVSVWRDMGAELNLSKTIYSTIKFIYLNRMYCQGSEVLVDMKTFAKIDRDYTRRLSSLIVQVDTVLGSARASSARGSDPILCYYYAIRRAVDLTLQANNVIERLDRFQQVAAFHAPRGLGGMGIPHIIGFLSKERLDPYTMFTAIVCKLKEKMSDMNMRRKLNKYAMAFINKNLKPPTAMGVIANPMAVYSGDHVNVEGSIYSKLKKRMKDRCRSKIMKQAFSLSESQFSKDVLDKFLKSVVIDAGLLAALGETLPSTCIQGLIDKAHKADLILALFPSKVRTELVSRIKGGNWKLVDNMYKTVICPAEADEDIDPYNYVEIISELRQRYFDLSGYTIINASYPDPGACLARQQLANMFTLTVMVDPPISHCSDTDDLNQYRNWLDGCSQKATRAGARTAGYLSDLPETTRGMTPVQKCLLKLAQVSAHASNMIGANEGSIIWRIGCLMWEAKSDTQQHSPIVQIKPGVSWKRMLEGSRTHPISAFCNTHSCIIVKAHDLIKLCERNKNMLNLMSIITAVKAETLINAYAHGLGIPDMHYSLYPGSLTYDEQKGLCIHCPEMLQECLASVPSDGCSEITKTFIDAVGDYEDVAMLPDDSGIIAMCYAPIATIDRDNFVEGRRTLVSTHYESCIITCFDLLGGITVEPRNNARAHVGDYDDVVSRRIAPAAIRFRRYTERYGSNKATLKLLIEIFQDNVPKRPPREVYTARIIYIHDHLDEIYPKWKIYLSNSINALHNIRPEPTFEFQQAYAILGSLSQEQFQMLRIPSRVLSAGNEEHAKRLFISLLLVTLGKFYKKKQYGANAALSSSMMEKSWRFSSKRNRFIAEDLTSDERYRPPNVRIEINTRYLVSLIYKYAAEESISMATPNLIANIYNHSISQAIALRYFIEVIEPPADDNSYKIRPADTMNIRSREAAISRSIRSLAIHGYALNVVPISEAVDNIMSDCLLYQNAILGFGRTAAPRAFAPDLSGLQNVLSDFLDQVIEVSIDAGEDDGAISIVNLRYYRASFAVTENDYRLARSILEGNRDDLIESLNQDEILREDIEQAREIVAQAMRELDSMEGSVSSRDDTQ